MLNEEVTQILTDLGLSPLQAKVYYALVRVEDPTANAASKLAKVARQEVYRITEELEETGLVSRTVSAPTRFQPLPLKEALSVLLNKKTQENAVLKKRVEEVNLEVLKRKELKHSSYTLKEIPENSRWFEDGHARFKASETFELMTSFRRFSARFMYEEELYREAAVKNKTKVRILTGKPTGHKYVIETINSLRQYPCFDMRFLDQDPDVVAIIFDRKDVAVSLRPANHVGPPYLFSNHPSIVNLAVKYFETLWSKAKPSMPYPSNNLQ